MKKIILSFLAVSLLGFSEPLKVQYVIDGDTVQFNNDIRCRLAYVDTPESYRNKKATRDVADCSNVSVNDIVKGGRIAKNYLKSVLHKGKTYDVLITDKESHRSKKQNRFICEIFDDGGSVNERLVRNGFAVPYWRFIRDRNKKDRYAALFHKAQAEQKGVWRSQPNVMECMK